MSIYYWNTSDNRDHTHHRIEWAVSNQILVCMNIAISDKLLAGMKIDDIILAYEPKTHKISKDKYGKDGLLKTKSVANVVGTISAHRYCCTCKKSRDDGRMSFMAAFKVVSAPYKIKSLDEYNQNKSGKNEILDHWFSKEFCSTPSDKIQYLTSYFQEEKEITIFPIELVKPVNIPIKPLELILIKGFDKITKESALQNIKYLLYQ